MNLCECDLTDVHAYAKYNDNHRYIISVTEVSSKCLHMVPVKTKSGTFVPSAFRSIFDYRIYSSPKRHPIWLRTDKDKEFLNNHFQDTLRGTGLQFHVCKNHDLKCVVVESAHRTICDTP